MADFSLRIEGLEELTQSFARAGADFRPLRAQAMVKSTQKIQNEGRAKIVANRTTYQGNLSRSWTAREATADRGVVAESEKYGAVVEYGRRPGKMPPIAPLERWAQIKLGTPGLGFVIARKIKQKGTKAQPFVEPTFRSTADFVLGQFAEAAKALVVTMAR